MVGSRATSRRSSCTPEEALRKYDQFHFEAETGPVQDPYHAQGNPEWDSPRRFRHRTQLRKSNRLRRACMQFWETLGKAPNEALSKAEYFSLHRCISKALAPEFIDEEAELAAQEDLSSDILRAVGGSDGLPLESFLESMAEIADMWTDEADELGYVVFINKLYRRITSIGGAPAAARPPRQHAAAVGSRRPSVVEGACSAVAALAAAATACQSASSAALAAHTPAGASAAASAAAAAAAAATAAVAAAAMVTSAPSSSSDRGLGRKSRGGKVSPSRLPTFRALRPLASIAPMVSPPVRLTQRRWAQAKAVVAFAGGSSSTPDGDADVGTPDGTPVCASTATRESSPIACAQSSSPHRGGFGSLFASRLDVRAEVLRADSSSRWFDLDRVNRETFALYTGEGLSTSGRREGEAHSDEERSHVGRRSRDDEGGKAWQRSGGGHSVQQAGAPARTHAGDVCVALCAASDGVRVRISPRPSSPVFSPLPRRRRRTRSRRSYPVARQVQSQSRTYL